MADPIHIDLRNLSQEHLAQCLPYLGSCQYESPCIIGTLVAPNQRGDMCGSIRLLIELGEVTVPDDQQDLAERLQWAFDQQGEKELRALVAEAMALPVDDNVHFCAPVPA